MAFFKKLLNTPLHWQILAAILIAFALSILLKETSHADLLLSPATFCGRIFMQALKMLVIPLVVSSLVTGVLSIDSEKRFARLGIKVFVYYFFSGVFAILTGMLLVNWIQPGVVTPEIAEKIIGNAPIDLLSGMQQREVSDLSSIFLRMVPENLIATASDNSQILGLICFSLIWGFAVTRLPANLREAQRSFWISSQEVCLMLTQWIIRLAPIGVWGLLLPVFYRTGLEVIAPLFAFFITVLLGLIIHMGLNLSVLMQLFGKINPIVHLRTMTPVLLTAFSTASSTATLPVTLEVTQKQAGVSSRVSSFTLPLGATVNMDGTALYECVVVMFIAQFYSVIQGFELTFFLQFKIVLLALLTSVGVAGIPAASLVAITMILGSIGLPLEAVGLVWITDRILDMCRTAVNVYSDTCGAVIVAKTEGESIYET
jgi:Na+/H+-dicarboxylate symporter